MAGFVADPGTSQTEGVLPTLTARLNALGKSIGATIYGISGYRTPAHSVAVGGFADDPHTKGEAEDIGVNSQSRSSAASLSNALLAKFGLVRPFDESGQDPTEVNHIQLLPGFKGSTPAVGRSRGVTKTNSLNVPGYVPKQYVSDVRNAAQGTGLPASVVAAQVDDESGFDPNSTSPTGAEGITQFEPATFAKYGKGNAYNPTDDFNAYTNYMNTLLRQFNGNVRDALAAYNAGPANLQAGYGYADAILSKAGVSQSSTAGSKSSYGGTRPGGQPVTGNGSDTGQSVDQLFTDYENTLNAPRVAPPGTKNPFSWWLMSFTDAWEQEEQGVGNAGQGAAQGIQSVANG